jgi:hypothetical protein
VLAETEEGKRKKGLSPVSFKSELLADETILSLSDYSYFTWGAAPTFGVCFLSILSNFLKEAATCLFIWRNCFLLSAWSTA